MLSAIRTAEDLGLHAVYVADGPGYEDPFLLPAIASQRTSCIRLCPGATNVVLQTPSVVAQQTATLDELTGRRSCAEQARAGAESAGRDIATFDPSSDLADSTYGAIAENGSAAELASRVMVAVYAAANTPAVAERNGLDPTSSTASTTPSAWPARTTSSPRSPIPGC